MLDFHDRSLHGYKTPTYNLKAEEIKEILLHFSCQDKISLCTNTLLTKTMREQCPLCCTSATTGGGGGGGGGRGIHIWRIMGQQKILLDFRDKPLGIKFPHTIRKLKLKKFCYISPYRLDTNAFKTRSSIKQCPLCCTSATVGGTRTSGG